MNKLSYSARVIITLKYYCIYLGETEPKAGM